MPRQFGPIVLATDANCQELQKRTMGLRSMSAPGTETR
jgi:hypothetical protein